MNKLDLERDNSKTQSKPSMVANTGHCRRDLRVSPDRSTATVISKADGIQARVMTNSPRVEAIREKKMVCGKRLSIDFEKKI